jgi:hypothetical protein
MVNYDLPWNPNRLEQRFGRIHRIGQTEVCHLWNLVADDSREGDVYRKLLEKLEQARKTLRSNRSAEPVSGITTSMPLLINRSAMAYQASAEARRPSVRVIICPVDCPAGSFTTRGCYLGFFLGAMREIVFSSSPYSSARTLTGTPL